MPLLLALDQSTSATKANLFNHNGHCLDRESRIHRQHYPAPGFVEHDAEEIWQNVLSVARTLINRNQQRIDQLVGISITNQRETIVVFDRETGKPLYPAMVWQCRRGESLCKAHINTGHSELVSSRTGLRLDPYFSASKIQWLLQNNASLKAAINSGKALIGTIETYLIYRLTQCSVFATDHTNASRTLLYDIGALRWDQELCALWQVPLHSLAEVRSSEDCFGETTLNNALKHPIPIVGVIGDSQASLFAQRCFDRGSAKATFGTGSSLLLNIGSKLLISKRGVVTALAWVHGGKPTYAFEGIIINSAATLEWLKNQLGFVDDINEFETLSKDVSDSGGVFLVPAFSGLGFPHWRPDARAAIVGLSGHSDRRHIARAAIESIAYQLCDAVDAMQNESGIDMSELKVDGGPTNNKFLMQFTADIMQTNLAVSKTSECSALGAALMGFLGLGHFSSLDDIKALKLEEQYFPPKMQPSEASTYHEDWTAAVIQVLAGTSQQNV